ncbi:MAG: hypothetical protein ACK5MX_00225, partial [Pseudanabaena sp.]
VFFFLYLFFSLLRHSHKTNSIINQIFWLAGLRAATLILHWEGSIQAKIQKISILIMKSIFVFPATLVLETQKNDFYS